MTVIEFLSDYVQLVLTRASHEMYGVPFTVVFTEGATRTDDDSPGFVATATVTGPGGGSVDISVGFPLYAELNHQYAPVLSDEEWAMIKGQITARVAV